MLMVMIVKTKEFLIKPEEETKLLLPSIPPDPLTTKTDTTVLIRMRKPSHSYSPTSFHLETPGLTLLSHLPVGYVSGPCPWSLLGTGERPLNGKLGVLALTS